MATILARCARCGDLELRPPQVRLVVREGHGSCFGFRCPACGDEVRRQADEVTVLLLIAAGVINQAAPGVPAHDAGPITEAEIEMFVRGFDDDALDELLGRS